MSQLKNVLEFYIKQSPISDPKMYGSLFEGLPSNLAALCDVVRGLIFHYQEGRMYGYKVPKERVQDDAAREVSAMLEKMKRLHDGPLTQPRSFEQRLVGCCRDYALLLCSILRFQGVPAKVRYGWSLYFNESFACDHVVAEYWNTHQGRWCLVDVQQDQKHVEINGLVFDPHDVPRDWFLIGGRAWQLARSGLTDPQRFGYSKALAGLWVLRTYLLHDFAALTKREMLIGDLWGADLDLESKSHLRLLDVVARATQHPTDLETLTKLYEDERLRIPPMVEHRSLYAPSRPFKVDVAAFR